MKFGQLIDYNMRKIFLKKSYTKCGGKTIPRPFSEKLQLSISLDEDLDLDVKSYAVCLSCKLS